MNRDVLKVQINKIVERINKDCYPMEHIMPHAFRHTFATRSIENGMGMNTLKVILGHMRISQTMDLYAHVLPDTKEKEMKNIEGLF